LQYVFQRYGRGVRADGGGQHYHAAGRCAMWPRRWVAAGSDQRPGRLLRPLER
jgi:hypothetical protein